LDGEIAVNPLHRVATYRYPVLAINANFKPSQPPAEPIHVIAFRDVKHQYGALDVNPIALRLFVAVRDHPRTPAREVLSTIARDLAHPDPNKVLAGGLDILNRMRQRGLILGTR
ncbi:MAG: HvfC family peptide modification chaperone, partial [Gammaproteobacteria bacterium]